MDGVSGICKGEGAGNKGGQRPVCVPENTGRPTQQPCFSLLRLSQKQLGKEKPKTYSKRAEQAQVSERWLLAVQSTQGKRAKASVRAEGDMF